MTKTGNGWIEYKQLVLTTMDEMKETIKEVNEKVVKNEMDILVFKTKAKMYGAFSGGVVAFAVFVIQILLNIFDK